jgi:hypothetical protein
MILLKLKYFYIVSILVLAVLAVVTVFRPIVKGEEYTEVRRDSLLRAGNEWIIQFDILNREGKEQRYCIEAMVSGKVYVEEILVLNKRTYTYIYHVPRGEVTDDEVNFAIFRGGEDVPVKKVSYHLR